MHRRIQWTFMEPCRQPWLSMSLLIRGQPATCSPSELTKDDCLGPRKRMGAGQIPNSGACHLAFLRSDPLRRDGHCEEDYCGAFILASAGVSCAHVGTGGQCREFATALAWWPRGGGGLHMTTDANVYRPRVRGLMQEQRWGRSWLTGRALSPASGSHVEIQAQHCQAFQ